MDTFDWIQLPNLEIRTGNLGISEVRDGPSAHVLSVDVAPGTYRPCLGLSKSENPSVGAFRLVCEKALGGWRRRVPATEVGRGGVGGWVSTDLASIGVFDQALFDSLRFGDPTGYAEWAGTFYDAMDWPHGTNAFGGDSRATVFYVRGDNELGPFPVSELILDGEPVGIEVLFDAKEIEAVDESTELQMIWVGGTASDRVTATTG